MCLGEAPVFPNRLIQELCSSAPSKSFESKVKVTKYLGIFLIPSGNIQAKPGKLGSKKKMLVSRCPSNECTNGFEGCNKKIYHHKTERSARRCLANMFSDYRVTH